MQTFSAPVVKKRKRKNGMSPTRSIGIVLPKKIIVPPSYKEVWYTFYLSSGATLDVDTLEGDDVTEYGLYKENGSLVLQAENKFSFFVEKGIYYLAVAVFNTTFKSKFDVQAPPQSSGIQFQIESRTIEEVPGISKELSIIVTTQGEVEAPVSPGPIWFSVELPAGLPVLMNAESQNSDTDVALYSSSGEVIGRGSKLVSFFLDSNRVYYVVFGTEGSFFRNSFVVVSGPQTIENVLKISWSVPPGFED